MDMAYNNDDFSRLEINLAGCLDNYKYFRSKLEDSTKLLVLVKANAYGHGAVEFASVMEKAGADYMAVAYPVEGIELRQGGIKSQIMVLTAGTDFFNEIIDNELEPGIPNLTTLKALCQVLAERGVENYPIHIKLDTGMHRLGFMSEELGELIAYLKGCRRVHVKSVYSHLAASDDPTHDEFTLEQIDLFKANADRMTSALGYKPMYHILNSAGIERFPQYQFDMVRLGIGIYGVSALPDVSLCPVASFKCKILQVKTLCSSDGTIGYGRHGKIAPEGTVIATIPVGYADGLDRHLSVQHRGGMGIGTDTVVDDEGIVTIVIIELCHGIALPLAVDAIAAAGIDDHGGMHLAILVEVCGHTIRKGDVLIKQRDVILPNFHILNHNRHSFTKLLYCIRKSRPPTVRIVSPRPRRWDR